MKKTVLSKISTLFLGLFLAIFLAGCKEDKKTQEKELKSFSVGEEITLKSVIGNEVTIIRTEKGFKLKDEDKILMIDIFATFCEPCKDEAPHLMDYQIRNSDEFFMIGLIMFEDLSDEYIIENFIKKYNAYYFIANSKSNENDAITQQILKDINYQRALSIPFKVVYDENGVIQNLTNNENILAKPRNFYLGSVNTKTIEDDIKRIKSGSN